jgi:peptide deformylase
MIKPIVIDLKELRKPSDLVLPNEDITEIIKDLEDTFAALKGYGLAAPQIGVKKRIAIVRYENMKYDLINPKIIGREGKIINRGECCFSIGSGKLPIDTDRYHSIILKNGLDEQCFACSGLEAIIMQHEIDHLNGVTIIDRKHKAR